MRALIVVFLAFLLAVPTWVALGAVPVQAQGVSGLGLSPAQTRELRAELDRARRGLARVTEERDRARGEARRADNRAVAARASLGAVGRIFGMPAGTPDDQIIDALANWYAQDQDSRTRLAELTHIISRIERDDIRSRAEYYVDLAQLAFEDGRLDEAAQALADLENLRQSSSAEAAELWVAAVQAQAGLARQRRDFGQAEALFEEAVLLEEQQSRDRLFALRFDWAGTAYERGDAGDDSAAVERAIQLYRECLALADQSEDVERWALTQNSLGVALTRLGLMVTGETNLDIFNQAVVAYEAALGVFARDTMELDWAMTQNNLGAARRALGERLSGPAGVSQLRQSVAAYQSALEVYRRDMMLIDWAMAQSNLGRALQTLAQRVRGPSRLTFLTQAVTAHEAALEVRTREAMPTEWARTQTFLVAALGQIGAETGDFEPALAKRNDLIAALEIAERVEDVAMVNGVRNLLRVLDGLSNMRGE